MRAKKFFVSCVLPVAKFHKVLLANLVLVDLRVQKSNQPRNIGRQQLLNNWKIVMIKMEIKVKRSSDVSYDPVEIESKWKSTKTPCLAVRTTYLRTRDWIVWWNVKYQKSSKLWRSFWQPCELYFDKMSGLAQRNSLEDNKLGNSYLRRKLR